MATSPAYFRGFTLIALKEGRKGTADDDYTGQFQVRSENTDFTLNYLCCDKECSVVLKCSTVEWVICYFCDKY